MNQKILAGLLGVIVVFQLVYFHQVKAAPTNPAYYACLGRGGRLATVADGHAVYILCKFQSAAVETQTLLNYWRGSRQTAITAFFKSSGQLMKPLPPWERNPVRYSCELSGGRPETFKYNDGSPAELCFFGYSIIESQTLFSGWRAPINQQMVRALSCNDKQMLKGCF